jgi:carboxyl-terminal processing protease
MFSRDSIHFDEDLTFETLKNKRVVYGGGGIMPDIFVPMDTSVNYGYFNQLVRQNVIYSSVLDQLDQNRDGYEKKFTSFETFSKNFEVGDEMVEKIMAEADKEKIEKDEKGVEFARPILKRQVKALIARDLFGQSAFYQIINEDEDAVKEALKVLKNRSEYNSLLVEK